MKTAVQAPVKVSLGGRCKNRCLFCEKIVSESKESLRIEQIPTPRTRTDRLVIWGREPALFEGLARFVESAAARGFSSIRLETCGQAPSSAIADLKRAGVNEISIMLPAHTSSLYGKITGNPGGFDKCIASL
ncbi:MAG TPA: radical SAM protein, partial [bacterium]|nr:radical SAM protein [bacterium]